VRQFRVKGLGIRGSIWGQGVEDLKVGSSIGDWGLTAEGEPKELVEWFLDMAICFTV